MKEFVQRFNDCVVVTILITERLLDSLMLDVTKSVHFSMKSAIIVDLMHSDNDYVVLTPMRK